MAQDKHNLFITPVKANPDADVAIAIRVTAPADYLQAHAAMADAAEFSSTNVNGRDRTTIHAFTAEQWAKAEAAVRKAAFEDIMKGPEERAEAMKVHRAEQRTALDKHRLPVKMGEVEKGQFLEKDGAEYEVLNLSRSWLIDANGIEALKERFPKADFEVGDRLCFASLKTPEVAARMEEAQTRREAHRQKADLTRWPIKKGSLNIGQSVERDGSELEVISFGEPWKLETDEDVLKLAERFPDVEFEVGEWVQFARHVEPELEMTPESSMG